MMMLWLFVFLVPWENVIVIPGLGTGAKLWGLATGVIGLSAVLLEGRVRFHPFLLAGLLFVAWGWASVLWSMEPKLSIERMLTYTGLWLMTCLAYHYGTPSLMFQAYVYGAWVAVLATIQAYMQGIEVVYGRFAARGFDPNDLSFYLNLAIPMAAYFALRVSAAAIRILYLSYIPVAVIAVLLTASRAGALGLVVALLYVSYSFFVRNWKWRLAWIFLLIGTTGLVLAWVPQASLARIATLVPEVYGGTLNERLTIWTAASQVFTAHPLLGVGAGAFSYAVEPVLGEARAPHNVFIAIAVEEGIPGLILWLLLMVFPFANVLRLPRHERYLWLVLLMVLTLGFLSLNLEWRKVSWLMLAFAAAHSTETLPKPHSLRRRPS